MNSRVAVNSIKEAESKKKIELMDAQVFDGRLQKYMFNNNQSGHTVSNFCRFCFVGS
jgi:hypothetical protein